LKLTAFLKLAERFILSNYDYAHRGLWSALGPTENSLEAFMLAANNGFGIEFDVRPSRDGVPLIYHDLSLKRLTKLAGDFENYDAADLVDLPLIGGGEIISLQTLLENWPTRAPLLCELKIDGDTDPIEFTRNVAKQMSAYNKPAAMMSFSAEAVEAIPADIQRGQLIDASANIGRAAFEAALSKYTQERCDYIACHVSDSERAVTPMPICVWTVKDAATYAHLSGHVDAQIFEGFDPRLVSSEQRNT
jgi:glycerophosphoryl diester phosphodiesterase